MNDTYRTLLQTSDIIEIFSIIASLTTSIVAIVISMKSLQQNNKMLENTFRPYIGIYGISTYINTPQYYIIVKNFGQSIAHIEHFRCKYDLTKIACENGYQPFSKIEGTNMIPGQTYRAAIAFSKVEEQNISYLEFHVVYSSDGRQYTDDIRFKIDANIHNLERHANTYSEDLTMQIIGETLQDIHIKSL